MKKAVNLFVFFLVMLMLFISAPVLADTPSVNSTVHLFLNGTEGNRSYFYGQSMNITGLVETPSNGTGILYRDGTPMSSTNVTYQENGTSFAWDGTWASDVTRVFDGYWNTWSYSIGISNFYENYTKPVHVTSALWKVMYESFDLYSTENYTVPSSCLEQSELMFRVYYQSHLYVYFYCWDGSDWNLIFTPRNDYSVMFFEDGVYWKINPSEYVQLSAGFYNYTLAYLGDDNYNPSSETYFANVTLLCSEGGHRCDGSNRELCSSGNWTFEETCSYGCDLGSCNAPPPVPLTGAGAVISDVGSGLGNFLSAIYLPLGNLILILGIIAGVVAIFLGIAYVVKRAIEKPT